MYANLAKLRELLIPTTKGERRAAMARHEELPVPSGFVCVTANESREEVLAMADRILREDALRRAESPFSTISTVGVNQRKVDEKAKLLTEQVWAAWEVRQQQRRALNAEKQCSQDDANSGVTPKGELSSDGNQPV